jgi:hypothetical protein
MYINFIRGNREIRQASLAIGKYRKDGPSEG